LRRGDATALATIVPRRGWRGGEAVFPLVVATAAKQPCELVRAKEAIFF
jgi:hypothetical protein